MGVEPNSAGVPWSLLIQPRKSNSSLCHMPSRVSPLTSSKLDTSSDFFQTSSNTQLHSKEQNYFMTSVTFCTIIFHLEKYQGTLR